MFKCKTRICSSCTLIILQVHSLNCCSSLTSSAGVGISGCGFHSSSTVFLLVMTPKGGIIIDMSDSVEALLRLDHLRFQDVEWSDFNEPASSSSPLPSTPWCFAISAIFRTASTTFFCSDDISLTPKASSSP